MRRYLPWLYAVAAGLALVATLTAKHVNWWWAAEKATRVLIAVGHLLPHHSLH